MIKHPLLANALAAAVLVGVLIPIVAAPSAHALCTPQQWQQNPSYCQQIFQEESQYNAGVSQLICDLVSQQPTPRGIWAALSYLLSEQRGEMPDRGKVLDAMGPAINAYCPQYNSVYQAYRSSYP